MRWIALPFLAYILLLPIIVIIETIGGRGAVGENAFDEYLILVQILVVYNIFIKFKKIRDSNV